jgi:phytanoyl-CoA hydroxylase
MIVADIGVLAGDRTRGSLTPEQVEFYRTEGYLVLPRLLTDEDMAPARAAMAEKVSEIAADLYAGGLVSDTRDSDPFKTRLARLFDGLTDADFLARSRRHPERVATREDWLAGRMEHEA